MGSAAVQGRLWGAAPDDWSELNEPLFAPLYEEVLDAVRVGAGTRLLDLGCGSGLAVRLAADRGALVSGLDASEGLLGVARARAPEADLRLGDLEDLPFGDDAFDAVTSFNAVQYAADPVAALREARRVARPGAPVVVVTWAEPDRCESRTVLAALGGLLPPPPPGAGGPFALSAPGRLEELVSAAGLRPARAAEAPVPFVFADLDVAVRAMLSAGPARIAVDHAGEEAAAEAIRTALAGAMRPGGGVRQENAFRYLIAEA